MAVMIDPHDALAALAWQIELGADEAILDVPVNRYDAPTQPPKAPTASLVQSAKVPAPAEPADPVAAAEQAAEVSDLAALQVAIASFDLCELKKGAKSCVFADGHPTARVMIIGEAPGRDEDIQGKPFVGRAGQLLDRMLAGINMARTDETAERGVYITNVIPWRPPQNRDPKLDEIAMMLPFVRKHIALAAPDFLVLMGNSACQALLGRKGITKLRGTWQEVEGRPTLPMFHPAYLLRNPLAKREAWADLLLLQDRLRRG